MHGRVGSGHLYIAVFAASCALILVYLWSSFGGAIPLKPKNYRVSAEFPNATNLGINADVRISGVNVGHVVAKQENVNDTRVTFDLEPQYAPLPVDAGISTSFAPRASFPWISTIVATPSIARVRFSA